jgi:hypothetical protein
VARFSATVDGDAPPQRTWERLVDWPAHGRYVPLTQVRLLTPSGSGVGARFVGRTGIGRLAFDDPMEVVQWIEPAGTRPGFCRVVKQGRVVLGEAWFEVAPRDGGGSRVTWTEEIELAPARWTRPLAPLVALAGRLAFTRFLRGVTAEAARDAAPGR